MLCNFNENASWPSLRSAVYKLTRTPARAQPKELVIVGQTKLLQMTWGGPVKLKLAYSILLFNLQGICVPDMLVDTQGLGKKTHTSLRNPW